MNIIASTISYEIKLRGNGGKYIFGYRKRDSLETHFWEYFSLAKWFAVFQINVHKLDVALNLLFIFLDFYAWNCAFKSSIFIPELGSAE